MVRLSNFNKVKPFLKFLEHSGWHSDLKLLRKDTWEDEESFLEVIIVDKRWWEYHQSLKWLMNFGPGYFFIFPWSICMIACASASLVTMTTTISFSLFLLLLGALLQRRFGKIFWVGSTSIQINSSFEFQWTAIKTLRNKLMYCFTLDGFNPSFKFTSSQVGRR